VTKTFKRNNNKKNNLGTRLTGFNKLTPIYLDDKETNKNNKQIKFQ
jgi:hypothetical protein